MNHPLLVVLLATLCLGGCLGESSEDHGGSEHFVPLHWPTDLKDAAEKIRYRVEVLRGEPGTSNVDSAEGHQAEQELRDIVGWIPEVAADTDLNEAQWLPIHHASASLSKRLRRMPRPLDTLTLAELEAYSELLMNQAGLISIEPSREAEISEPTESVFEQGDR